ncbi:MULTISPECIES: hypothetical protein [Streptomyces]|uniref:hypothetical protein n=1 Tax=Streptomyces TaxID=1883 RepID=UPI0011470204|nr:hypothetical protein [Streptomyces sp. F-7]
MQWPTYLAAALGAIAGSLGTGIADRFRWHRDVSERERQERQTAYANFLDAVKRTGIAISQAAHEETLPLEDRARQARQAMGQHGLYETQAQAELCAPKTIIPLMNELVRALLSLRDAVIGGEPPGAPRYEGAWLKVHTDTVQVREAMRTTLSRK